MNTLLHTDHNERYYLYLAADAAAFIDALNVELVGHTSERIERRHEHESIASLFKRAVHMLGLIRVSKPVRPLRAFAPNPPPPPFAIITAIDTGATRKRITDRLFQIADNSDSQDLRVKALCALADIYHMGTENVYHRPVH